MSELYKTTIQTNAILLNNDPKLIEMRELMSDENINKIMREQAKKDPELAKYLTSVGGKLAREQSVEVSAYNLSNSDTPTQIRRLQLDTESIYHNLWAINQRLKQLPKFKNFEPSGVRNVRNRLIEHIDNPKTSGAHIYSFGVATRGPALRPTKPAGVKAPNDAGLEANTEEFFSKVIALLS